MSRKRIPVERIMGNMWCNVKSKGETKLTTNWTVVRTIQIDLYVNFPFATGKSIEIDNTPYIEFERIVWQTGDEDWSINRANHVCHWNLYGVDFFQRLKWKRTMTRQWMVRSTITCCRKWRWQESGTSSRRKRSDKEAHHFLSSFQIIATYEEIQVHAEVVIHNCTIFFSRGNQLVYKL